MLVCANQIENNTTENCNKILTLIATMIVRNRKRTYCSVANCTSGRNGEREKRKKRGLRQLALFGVPKDLSLRKKWSQNLGQVLMDRDSVCELHFPINAMNKYHRTLLPDGTIEKMERVRYLLKPRALPLRNKKEPEGKKNDTTDRAGPNCLKLEIVGSHSLIIPDPSIKEYQEKKTCNGQIKEILSLSDVNIGLNVTIDSTADEIIVWNDPDCKLEDSFKDNTSNVVISSIGVSEKSDCNNTETETDNRVQSTDAEVLFIQTNPQYDHCYYRKSCESQDNVQETLEVMVTEQQKDLWDHNSTKKPSNSVDKLPVVQPDEVESSHQKSNLIMEKTSTQQRLLDHNSTKNESTSQLGQKPCISNKVAPSPNANASISQVNKKQQYSKKRKIESAQSTEVLQKFNLYSIRDYFVKNPLPKSWTWIESKKFDTIIFVQISRATQHIRCYVECKEDLSIHVFTFDRHKISQLDTVITSIDDILNLLLKVYNTRLCESNIANETRSENCSLLLSEQEMKQRKLPIDRCSNCRNEKKSKSKFLSEFKVKGDGDKNRELSQKLHQMTKSCEYYRQKCEKMKEMVQNLKQLCINTQNTAKKTALYEAIIQLPIPQQAVVRACFSNVDIEPKARRYEPNYAYECFLLQAVSDAAYDHIKQRNLLPLPCKRTLKRMVTEESKT